MERNKSGAQLQLRPPGSDRSDPFYMKRRVATLTGFSEETPAAAGGAEAGGGPGSCWTVTPPCRLDTGLSSLLLTSVLN